MAKRWSDEELDILSKNYGSVNMDCLLQLLTNRNRQNIYSKASQLGLKCNYEISQPRTKVNDNFFADPNPICSYWAGFIASDGYIDKNLKSFGVTQADIKPLEKLKNSCSYEGNIQYREKIVTEIMGRVYDIPKISQIYTLKIKSSQMVYDLINNYNITPQKSLTLKPPIKLKGKNTLSFITGYLDGDGSIHIQKHKKGNWYKYYIITQFTGTLEVLTWIKTILNCGGNIYQRTKNKNTWKLQYSAKASEKVLGKLLSVKELNDVRCSHKWDKILEWERLQQEKAA